MSPNSPKIAIGGQLPPIQWIAHPAQPIYRHKTYFELRGEGIVTPYYRFSNWVNLDDLPQRYYDFIGNRERISLSMITPTQAKTLKRIVAHYIAKKRLVDDLGNLPYGIRFIDSSLVYCLNGHHRLVAAQRLGRTHMRMVVESYPFTLSEALKGL